LLNFQEIILKFWIKSNYKTKVKLIIIIIITCDWWLLFLFDEESWCCCISKSIRFWRTVQCSL